MAKLERKLTGCMVMLAVFARACACSLSARICGRSSVFTDKVLVEAIRL